MNRKKIKFIEPKFILRKLDLSFLKQAQEMLSPLFLTHEAKVKKAHTLLGSPISDHARPGIRKSWKKEEGGELRKKTLEESNELPDFYNTSPW